MKTTIKALVKNIFKKWIESGKIPYSVYIYQSKLHKYVIKFGGIKITLYCSDDYYEIWLSSKKLNSIKLEFNQEFEEEIYNFISNYDRENSDIAGYKAILQELDKLT